MGNKIFFINGGKPIEYLNLIDKVLKSFNGLVYLVVKIGLFFSAFQNKDFNHLIDLIVYLFGTFC